MPRRLVKKYANRRLYDVESSRYITQSALKDLIVSGAAVQVVDARSGADLTREVLLQIVAEQEQLGVPILTESTLLALIRFYGHPLQQLASRYLETSLARFVTQSSEVAERMQRAALTPAQFLNRMAQGGFEWWAGLQGSHSQNPPAGTANSKSARKTTRKRKKSR